MRLIRLATLVLAAAAVAACNRAPGPAAARPRVALVLKTVNNPFFIDMQRGAEQAATDLNVDLVVQAAERETDVDRQMQIVENLIQARVGAIALTPSGSRELVPAVGKATRAGTGCGSCRGQLTSLILRNVPSPNGVAAH